MTGYFRAYSNRVREASRELEERELRVYVALLSYADCRGKCWPGIKALTQDTGLCTDAILSALDALVTKKYVQIVRRGTRDVETGISLPNVYKIDGAVTGEEDCPDIEQMYDPILALSSNEESQHHHRTDSYNTTKETQPETPPPTQPISSKVEVPKTKTTAKTQSAATPTRSVNTNSPDRVPRNSRNFYTGNLAEFAQPLADDDEQIVQQLRDIDARMTIRTARYLVASAGAKHVLWAIGFYRKQTDIYNPAGYMRALIERHAVESVDALNESSTLINSWKRIGAET